MHEPSGALARQIQAEGFELVRIESEPGGRGDADDILKLAQRSAPGWIAVDGYQFDATYRRALKDSGLLLLVVDDYGGQDDYAADVIVNPRPLATRALYPSLSTGTKLLAGAEYCLLRSQFARWRGWRRETSASARKILVTMGGSDPEHLTPRVVDSLRRVDLPGMEVVAVVGADNPGVAEVRRTAGSSIAPIRTEPDVADMAALMAWADLAITAAGGTVWELLFMGCPALVFSRSRTQAEIFDQLARNGAVVHAGSASAMDGGSFEASLQELGRSAQRRLEVTAVSQNMVDGRGVERVLEEMTRVGRATREGSAT